MVNASRNSNNMSLENKIILRGGEFGTILAFQPGGPGSIPGWDRNFNFYPGTGRLSFVLACVVSGSDILLA